jgi:hypothetical protein
VPLVTISEYLENAIVPFAKNSAPNLACALMITAGIALSACGGDRAAPDAATSTNTGEYVFEKTSVDGIETMRTVSGSRWGREGQLVEELAIGAEMGEEAYLFGSISSAWATEDRIYVVDSQIPAVRAFDSQGNFLFQVGRSGQGPGEYGRPVGIAVRRNGQILISDLQGARVNVFDAAGEPVDDWSLGSPQAALGLQLTYDDEIYTRMIELPSQMTAGDLGTLREGMQPVAPGGRMGEPIFPPEIDYEPPTVQIDMGGNSMSMAILPFTPSYEWAFAPGGQMIAGVGNEYRFEIRTPTNRRIVVEKAWEPVAVDPGERGFRAELAADRFRQMAPDFTIPESDVPSTKPAFTRLLPDRSQRVWVVRQGPSVPDPTCAESGGSEGVAIMIGAGGGANVVRGDGFVGGSGGEVEDEQDCWANTHVFDVFEIGGGDFLGTVPAPERGFTRPLFADGDTVLAAVTDEAGTVRLKKYRLVVD